MTTAAQKAYHKKYNAKIRHQAKLYRQEHGLTGRKKAVRKTAKKTVHHKAVRKTKRSRK
jgi:hypothetical protein